MYVCKAIYELSMKKVFTQLSVFLIFMTGAILSQAQPMRFETYNATYSPLTGATNIAGTVIWDDPEFDLDNSAFTLGFPIKGVGKFTDTAYMSDGYFYIPDSSGDGGFYLESTGQDLVDRGYLDDVSALSPILTKTTGTAGNRVFHIEWKNFGFYNEYNDSNTLNDYGNVQVRIFEKDGTIEMHYGDTKVNAGASLDGASGYNIFIGVLDFSNLDLKGMSLTGNPASPAVKYNNWNGVLNALPENGRVYAFRFNLDSATAGVKNPTSVQVKTYPQPASEILNIELPDTKTGADYQIYSVRGQLMAEATLEAGQRSISVSDLAPGLYVLKMQQDGRQYHSAVQITGRRN